MRKIILILLFVGIIMVIASLFIPGHDCSYSNYNSTFTFEDKNFNGRDFRMCKAKFEEFKKINRQDTVLYRVCKKNPIHFWRSNDPLVREKYKLPYLSWDEIAARRGAIQNKTGFQDF